MSYKVIMEVRITELEQLDKIIASLQATPPVLDAQALRATKEPELRPPGIKARVSQRKKYHKPPGFPNNRFLHSLGGRACQMCGATKDLIKPKHANKKVVYFLCRDRKACVSRAKGQMKT